MQLSDFGGMISKYSIRLAMGLKHSGVKEEVKIEPNMTGSDKYAKVADRNGRYTPASCEAARLVVRGRLVTDAQIKERLSKISPEILKKGLNVSDDIDKDGRTDAFEMYLLKPLIPIPDIPGAALCGKKDWDVIENKFHTLLFIFHFSAEENKVVHVMIESTLFLLKGSYRKFD